VAAHLALGAPLGEAGEEVPPESLLELELDEPQIEEGRVVAHVVYTDRYGNAALDLADRHLPRTGLLLGRPVAVEVAGASREAVFTLTFGDVPEEGLILYQDSYRHLALSVNRGSAAEELGIAAGDEVVLRPVG
jgi:S-adenosylmethionine hydrolase